MTEDSKQKIRKHVQALGSNVVFAVDHGQAVRGIEEAEVLLGYITPEMLRNAKGLRWVQAPMASFGVSSGEYYIFLELAESDIVVSNIRI